MTVVVPDLLAYLDGRWRIERTLVDLASGQRGRFEGTLACGWSDGTYVLREDGDLHWGDAPNASAPGGASATAAHRVLFVRPGSDPGVADVHFEDGRYFHHLDLRTGAYDATHPCAPDTYEGRFEVDSREAWRYRWRVTGPRKNLDLATTLTRVGSAA